MDEQPHYYGSEPPRAARRGVPAWVWVVGVVVVVVAAGVAALAYVGTAGPETRVYSGYEVPQRYMAVMRETGMLDDDEEVRLFYSDALVDIRNGFYFVSDRKVGVYRKDAAVPALAIPFAEIESVELERNLSFFIDSTITLTLKDGRVIWIPVSSELGGDQHFHTAIIVPVETLRMQEGG
jgi:hypothetical protein